VIVMSRLHALAIAVPLFLGACSGGAVEPITMDPVTVTGQRTVASMLPKLTRSLTPSSAEATFGKPDEVTGSGLLIYVYRVEAGKSVYLSFPGFTKIFGASLRDASGGSQALPLLD
jgi:hypothetical protein